MMSQKNLGVADAVNTAIYNEKLSMDNYHHLAAYCRKAGNLSVAGFFEEQSKREKGHYNSLVKYKEKNALVSTLAPGEMVAWLSKEAMEDADISAEISLDDALAFIEEGEKSAERFYRQAAADAQNPELAEFFGKLADDEGHHLYLAGKIRTRLEQEGVVEPADYMDLGGE